MGYTHYYYVSKEFDYVNFQGVIRDFTKMMPVMEHLGVKLADGFGEGKPIITANALVFNGVAKCGHEKRQLGITWPSANAQGVSKNGVQTQLEELTKTKWFSGAQLEARACSGDCSHETFSLERKLDIPEYKQETKLGGKIFEFTKTAYKPYDLAVNVALIIAKHHLGSQIEISSDGSQENWDEGAQLCQHFLGYGGDFKISDEPELEAEAEPKPEEQIQDKTQVKIGDVFVQSWGYDQTNIDYIKVTGFTKSGKSARVVTIGSRQVEALGDMSDRIEPDPSAEVDNTKSTMLISGSNRDGSGERILKGTFYPMSSYKRSGYFHHQEGTDYRSSYA